MKQVKSKRNFQRNLGRSGEFTVVPSLTVNRDSTALPRETIAYKNDFPSRAKVAEYVSTPGSKAMHFLSEIETS